MPRYAPRFDDITLNLLHTAARRARVAHPGSNTAFLDRFIADAYAATNQLHSAQTYLHLLAGAGLERLPSAGTVQRAITRARAGTAAVASARPSGAPAVAPFTLAQQVARAMALLSPDHARSPLIDSGAERAFDATDAYWRLQRLEDENRALRVRIEELTAMLMAARVALSEALSRHGGRGEGAFGAGAPGPSD